MLAADPQLEIRWVFATASAGELEQGADVPKMPFEVKP